jgi:signal transduction histidine kinase
MLFAVPLFVVILFMRSVTEESISEIIKNQNSLIAIRAANEIELIFRIPDTVLKTLVETPELYGMKPQMHKNILKRIASQYQNEFHRIFTVDISGREIASSDSILRDTLHIKDDFFLEALKNDTNHISPLVRINGRTKFVISSHPIKRSNKIIGVLAGEIDLNIVWNMVNNIVIGGEAKAFILDGSGRLISHTGSEKSKNTFGIVDTPMIDDIKTAYESSHVFKSSEGDILLGTFVYLKKLDWIIVIQQPAEEAFALASNMLYEVLAFVVLVVLVAIILAILLEKRITEPIKALIRGVKRYAEGDLEYRIHIERYEEIALLAEEFNSMASSLLDNQSKLRRVERLAAMSKFATLVSHEIRNPLNSMNINMKILKREIDSPNGDAQKKQKYFKIISSEINRMDNLIKNFLMIARPPRFDFVRNDMHGILEEVILLHSENSNQQNVRIKKDFQDGKTIANVDRDQMKQVFHNLIINAFQAMPGGGELKIQTRLKIMDTSLDQNVQFIRIKFLDNGVGIPEDKINEIFEVYFTMKRTGTGLGLAIARQIVEGHFGSIDIKSKVGTGTTVTVSIPTNSDLQAF